MKKLFVGGIVALCIVFLGVIYMSKNNTKQIDNSIKNDIIDKNILSEKQQNDKNIDNISSMSEKTADEDSTKKAE